MTRTIKINAKYLNQLFEYSDWKNKKAITEQLKGIHFETKDDQGYAVATNRYQMLEIKLELDPEINITLVPLTKLGFSKLDLKYNNPITITEQETGLWMDNSDNVYKVAKDGTYPNWKCAIPRKDTPIAKRFALWDGKVMDALVQTVRDYPTVQIQQDRADGPAVMYCDNKTYVFMPMRYTDATRDADESTLAEKATEIMENVNGCCARLCQTLNVQGDVLKEVNCIDGLMTELELYMERIQR